MSLFTSIFFLFLGLAMFFSPTNILFFILYSFALLKIIIAGAKLSTHKKTCIFTTNELVSMSLDIVFGIAILFSNFISFLAISIIPIVFGLWTVTKGYNQIFYGYTLRNTFDKWWAFILLGAIIVFIGIYILFNPFGTMKNIISLFGILPISIGFTGLFNIYAKKKAI